MCGLAKKLHLASMDRKIVCFAISQKVDEHLLFALICRLQTMSPQNEIKVGDRVIVCDGKYTGAKGLVKEKTEKMRLVVFDQTEKRNKSARILTRSLCIEVKPKEEPVEDRGRDNAPSTIRALSNCPEVKALGSYLARLNIDPSKDRDVLGSIIVAYDEHRRELDEGLDARTREVERAKTR